MNCPQCGANNDESNKFCDSCGNNLSNFVSRDHNSTRPMQQYPQPVSSEQQWNNQPQYQSWNQQPIGQAYPPKNKPNRLKYIFGILFGTLITIGIIMVLLVFLANYQSNNSTNNILQPQQSGNSQSGNSENSSKSPLSDTSTFTGAYQFQLAEELMDYKQTLLFESADFENDGIAEIVVASSNSDGTLIEVSNWANNTLVVKATVNIPGPVYSLSSSQNKGLQYVYIFTDKQYYLLYFEPSQNGYFYETINTEMQPYDIAEGQLNENETIETLLYASSDDGTYSINYNSGVSGNKSVKVAPGLQQVHLVNIDGKNPSELVYLQNGKLNIYRFDGAEFLLFGSSDFGGSLMNYFPYDFENDGALELVNTYANSDVVSFAIWKWDFEKGDYISNYYEETKQDNDAFITPHALAGDFDGNGKIDVAFIMRTETQVVYKFYQGI